MPTAAFCGPDESRIVTGDGDGNVYFWDVAAAESDADRTLETAKKEYIGKPGRHGGRIHRLRVRHDGMLVLTASFDNTARLWDPQSGTQVGAPFEHQAGIKSAGFSPDGSRIATACDDTGILQF